MPVLVEGATWIARARVLDARVAGGTAAFMALVPPQRRSADGELVAISFPAAESRATARVLRGWGLSVVRQDGAFDDAAVFHHRMDPGTWCPWLELAVVPVAGGGPVLAAREAGSRGAELATPPGWRFDRSASAREGVAELSPADRPLRYLRREPDASVYVDRFTAAEVRVAMGDPPARVSVVTASGQRHDLVVEVVRDPRAIALGLMHRDRLEPDAGMLFDFGQDEWRSFWMKNTHVPLDMLFVRLDGIVTNVVERTRPLTLGPCRSSEPCARVLEVRAGWAAEHGVRAGDRLASC